MNALRERSGVTTISNGIRVRNPMPTNSLVLMMSLILTIGPLAASAQGPQAAHEGYAELKGVRIRYTDTGGSGIPVILLHAATGNIESWEHQIPAFTAAGYRCITYDRRGWGRSITDPAARQPGTAADDLLALMDYLHIDRAHLVGSAAGATVSIDFVLSFPQRVRSAVIANAGGASVQDQKFQEVSQRIKPAEFDSYPVEFRELGPSYRASNPEGTRRWIELTRMSRQNPAGPPQPVKNPITMPLLETIKTSVLLMTGAADLYAPPPLMRLYAARIKNAESIVIPEAGHSAYWEQPDIFNRAVLEFIRKH
jgi:pimeloyl-ACP methyl ester carboxylesterase